MSASGDEKSAVSPTLAPANLASDPIQKPKLSAGFVDVLVNLDIVEIFNALKVLKEAPTKENFNKAFAIPSLLVLRDFILQVTEQAKNEAEVEAARVGKKDNNSFKLDLSRVKLDKILAEQSLSKYSRSLENIFYRLGLISSFLNNYMVIDPKTRGASEETTMAQQLAINLTAFRRPLATVIAGKRVSLSDEKIIEYAISDEHAPQKLSEAVDAFVHNDNNFQTVLFNDGPEALQALSDKELQYNRDRNRDLERDLELIAVNNRLHAMWAAKLQASQAEKKSAVVVKPGFRKSLDIDVNIAQAAGLKDCVNPTADGREAERNLDNYRKMMESNLVTEETKAEYKHGQQLIAANNKLHADWSSRVTELEADRAKLKYVPGALKETIKLTARIKVACELRDSVKPLVVDAVQAKLNLEKFKSLIEVQAVRKRIRIAERNEGSDLLNKPIVSVIDKQLMQKGSKVEAGPLLEKLNMKTRADLAKSPLYLSNIRRNKWRDWIVNSVSILSVVFALARGIHSKVKYNTWKFWKTDTQKRATASKAEIKSVLGKRKP